MYVMLKYLLDYHGGSVENEFGGHILNSGIQDLLNLELPKMKSVIDD